MPSGAVAAFSAGIASLVESHQQRAGGLFFDAGDYSILGRVTATASKSPDRLPAHVLNVLFFFRFFWLLFCTHVADFAGLGNTLLCQRQSRNASPRS